MPDDVLFDKIFKYTRTLEGPAYIPLGEPRIWHSLEYLRRNLKYIISSEDNPFKIAENILDGKYKIKFFSRSFWSPILHARFPGVLPNWNNKTDRFFKKLGVKLTTSKLTTSEKYELFSNSFSYSEYVSEDQDFYNINHLMHYGTEIKEGKDLIEKLQNNGKQSEPSLLEEDDDEDELILKLRNIGEKNLLEDHFTLLRNA